MNTKSNKVNLSKEKEKKNSDALNLYVSRSKRVLILLAPIVAMVLGTVITVAKAMGFYPLVGYFQIVIFDVICLGAFFIGIVFLKKAFDEKDLIIKKYVRPLKSLTVILLWTEWNFMAYFMPTRDIWAFSFLFILLSAFYFDSVMTTIEAAGIVLSTIVFYCLQGGTLSGEVTALSMEDFVLRIFFVCMSIICICCLTDMGGRILVRNITEISEIDPLTHLMNRKRMRDVLDSIHERAILEGEIYSILIFDIDDFKKVNDTYGHSVGDETLVRVSKIFTENFRSNDYLFRWGGEEFLAVVKCNQLIATHIAERVVRCVEKEQMQFDFGIISVTVTAGVATFEESKSLDEIIKMADDNLYIGKRNGKNQVVA